MCVDANNRTVIKTLFRNYLSNNLFYNTTDGALLLSYFIFTKEKNWFELLLIYLVNVLLTNLVSMGVLYLKNDEIYSLITRFEVDYRFAFKYMILATVIGLVIGVVSAIIKKYLV